MGTDDTAAALEPLARVAGRYVIEDTLGTGGTASVYRARDQVTGRVVALKQLLSTLEPEKRALVDAMLEREYHTLVRLKHPRVVEVYEYGRTRAGPYYTMELLDGEDLQRLSPLPFRSACAYLRDVASVLSLLQVQRLVHRDLTPRNVRLTRAGHVKVLDFGTLHPFGTASVLVGTAPFVAPEALQGMPLDHRTDLYALGALAYYALTRRNAYAARRLDDLARVWSVQPEPPSRFAADVPPALDALVMSLLSLDPLSRPVSAALVIDQLTVIAQLEREDEQFAGEAYLRSSRMVGRELEQQWMAQRVLELRAGRGSAVVIDGVEGVGKTRLMHELALQGQIAGASVVKCDAEASSGALLGDLALCLLQACPERALPEAVPHAEVLASLSPELGRRLGVAEAVKSAEPLAEQHMQKLAAMRAWLWGIAREQPLLIAVDNMHAADENAAGLLAALSTAAREHALLLIATQRSEHALVAPAQVRATRKYSASLRLGALDAAACTQLVAALFGDVPNISQIAWILYQKSAGNPDRCMELVRLMVQRRIARHVDGTWVLPLHVPLETLPAQLSELVEVRLGTLGVDARALLEVLSVHDRPLPLDQCLRLSQSGREQTHAALQELISAHFLTAEGTDYRFAQEPVRQIVLARMSEPARAAHHRRAAEVLLAMPGESSALQLKAGWHLLHGGEEARGADLLAVSGRRFMSGLLDQGTPDQVAGLLRAALDVYERQGRSDYELAGVMFPMLALAFSSREWRLNLEYGERAIEIGMQLSGLGTAERLRTKLGRRLALVIGLIGADRRLARLRKTTPGPPLRELLILFSTAASATLSTFTICNDMGALERLQPKLAAFALFGADHPAAIVSRLLGNHLLLSHGKLSQALQDFERTREWLGTPQMKQAFGEARWSFVYGGVVALGGLSYAYGFGDRALRLADEAEGTAYALVAGAVDQLRVLYHAYRGESERVAFYRARIERAAVEASSMWQMECVLPACLLPAMALTGDTLATRRVFEQLTKLASEVDTLAIYARSAEAAYLMLRGSLREAIALYERLSLEVVPGQRSWWLSVRVFLAQCLNRNGEHARAKQVLCDALAAGEPDPAVGLELIEPYRQLALADLGLGATDAAAQQIDALLERHGAHDHPLLIGLLHKAGAEIALQSAAREAFDRHFEAMERLFRSTDNPALITQSERVLDQALRIGLRVSPGVSGRPGEATASRPIARSTAEGVDAIAVTAQPFDHALRLLMQRTRATAGYLYAFADGTLRLAAQSHPDCPPIRLEARLQQQARRALLEDAEDVDSSVVTIARTPLGLHHLPQPRPRPTALQLTEVAAGAAGALGQASSEQHADVDTESKEPVQTIVDAVTDPLAEDDHWAVLLRTEHRGRVTVVGGLIVELQPNQELELSANLLEAIADALNARLIALIP